MTFLPRLGLLLLLLSVPLLSACSESMQLKADAAWEKLDPMGHRKEHQMRNYPRGYNPGVRLPKGYQSW